jgi:hypothetical protein
MFRRTLFFAGLTLLVFLGGCECNLFIKDKIDFNLSLIPVYEWDKLQAAINTAPDGAIIGIMQNMEAEGTIDINTGKAVTLAAFKGDVVISRTTAAIGYPLFEVQSGGSLILGDDRGGTLVLDGKEIPGPYQSLVKVTGPNAYLIMNEGSVLRNNINDDFGGGVTVTSSGTFTMTGGRITYITATAATITLKGGGVYVNNGTFTMTGGQISGNTVFSTVVGAQGGGVYFEVDASGFGNFTMTGGQISGNKASSSPTSPPCGGGVYFKVDSLGSGEFIMTGGSIHDNKAKNGGGVYLADGTFTMNGGSIYDNEANTNGGGVYVEFGSITITPPATLADIYGNTPDQVYR